MVNKVTLIGNAGQDPDIRTLENGTKVGRISLATNESYKDKDGNWQTQTEWHNVVLWRELADRASSFIKKGSLVYIEGKIQARKYADKDGVERTSLDIVASTVRLLEKRERNEPDSQNMPNQGPPAQSQLENHNNQPAHGGDIDSLPF